IQIAQTITRTADGEALLVQQVAYATNQQYLVVLIIAAITAPLDWLELSKFLFPVAQYMRLDTAKVADFAYREVALGGNGRQGDWSFAGAHGLPDGCRGLTGRLDNNLEFLAGMKGYD